MGPRIGAPVEHHGFMLGAAAGFLFGVSDIAIKAISGMVGSHGVVGLLSPWMLVTIVASVGAFYASAKGLQDGDAVPVIAITGTAANVAGIVGGIIVFGDPLSGHPLTLAAECLAFGLVLVAAWLTPAPVRGRGSPRPPARPVRRTPLCGTPLVSAAELSRSAGCRRRGAGRARRALGAGCRRPARPVRRGAHSRREVRRSRRLTGRARGSRRAPSAPRCGAVSVCDAARPG